MRNSDDIILKNDLTKFYIPRELKWKKIQGYVLLM